MLPNAKVSVLDQLAGESKQGGGQEEESRGREKGEREGGRGGGEGGREGRVC